MELLTAAQMREIEQAAILSGAVTGLELMERAGRGVVDAIWEEWPELRATSGRAVVLCGPGNNGGDGFVVARLLREAGWKVEVLFSGAPGSLPPDARGNFEAWGAKTHPLTGAGLREAGTADLYVDAIFGIGLSRPVSGEIAELLRYLAGSGGDYGHFQPRLVSVDIPSGVCADSGCVLGCPTPTPGTSLAPFARLTVTFDAPKIGHFVGDGPLLCGKLEVVDIGVRRFREHQGGKPFLRSPGATLVTRRTLNEDGRTFMMPSSQFRQLAKAQGHKFAHGSALVLSGGVAKGGAARLAARAALRTGAGVVTVGCPPSAVIENASALDAVMVRRIEDGPALTEMLETDTRINALCLGPGMGTGEREVDLVDAALSARPEGKPRLCLDADALTLLAQDETLFGKLHDRCVLTPHAGEFARLFPDIAETLLWRDQNVGMRYQDYDTETFHDQIEAMQAHRNKLAQETGPAYSKVDATREAAKRAGCVVLFKGPDTVIADPDGRCSINAAVYDRTAPWLATAGSGDVLAGFITGLLARGFAPMQAAETGAWLHVECARTFGPGLIAEDLPETLPEVFRNLGV